MPERTPGEDQLAPDERKKAGFGFPFGMSRTQQMGNRGLAAASIGWSLAGCILLGFLAGRWLDSRFGTQVWTPILFLVGVAAGFREMFRTLEQLNAANEADRRARRSEAASTSSPTQVATAKGQSAAGLEVASQVLEGPPAQRQRLFTVPPPPFLEQPAEIGPSPSAEEVKRRLSGGDEEEQGKKRDAV